MTYYGQFTPPVDQFLYEKYFQGRATPGLCIECGAFDGLTESSCKFFEETLGWKAVNVEPYPHAYEQLVKNRPESINLSLALSDKAGVAAFTIALHPVLGPEFGNGSLSHLPEHRRELDELGCTYEQCQVETCTYAELVAALGLKEVDLFVLDVEGHELAVLDGMRSTPPALLPRVLCVEFGVLGLDVVRTAVEGLDYVLSATSNINAVFLRQDFSAIAGTLFAAGEPGQAWEVTEMEAVLRTLWEHHQALEKENLLLRSRTGP